MRFKTCKQNEYFSTNDLKPKLLNHNLSENLFQSSVPYE